MEAKFKPDDIVIYISWNQDLNLYSVERCRIESLGIYKDHIEYYLVGQYEPTPVEEIFTIEEGLEFMKNYFNNEKLCQNT